MSITGGKVKLYLRRRRNALVLWPLLALQFVLTVILSVSLAANIIWPEGAKGATPTPMQISYEGRLTDASGNALGGTGTAYCFRFSIYDSASNGNRLWPASATPNFTLATSTDGVFNAVIGQADTLTSTVFDFSTTSTAYLQVEVSSAAPTCSSGYETLSPRQPIMASPYAMTASNLGSSLRADTTGGPSGGPVVRVGTGSGAATPVYMDLDWKNTADYVGQTCSVNGQMWYNSNVAVSQAFICENGVIAALGASGTTTIAAISDGATVISNGTVTFGGGGNVTFGVAGNSITASAPAGGGGGATFSNFQWPPGQASSFNANMVNGGISIGMLNLPQNLSATRAQILASGSLTSVAGTLSISIGLYTLNTAASSLASVSSGSQSFAYAASATSAVNGLRRISVPININATPGDYWYMVRMSTAGAGSFTVWGGARSSLAFSGNLGVISATSRQLIVGIGSTSSAAMVNTIALNQIQGNAAAAARMPWILFSNIDIN